MTTALSVGLVIAAVFLVFVATRPEPKRHQRTMPDRTVHEVKPAQSPARTVDERSGRRSPGIEQASVRVSAARPVQHQNRLEVAVD